MFMEFGMYIWLYFKMMLVYDRNRSAKQYYDLNMYIYIIVSGIYIYIYAFTAWFPWNLRSVELLFTTHILVEGSEKRQLGRTFNYLSFSLSDWAEFDPRQQK